jgi:folate-binding protein YgfZ
MTDSSNTAETIDSLLYRVTGAVRADDVYGPQCIFAVPPSDPALGLVMPLLDLCVWSATGADTRSFLQGQLTNDVERLKSDGVQWSGYCNPKGRLLANLLLAADQDAVQIIVPRPQSVALRKRLSTFVLRAKVVLTDQQQALALFGLTGDAAQTWLQEQRLVLDRPLQAARSGGLFAVRLADLAAASLAPMRNGAATAAAAAAAGADLQRFLLCVPREQVETIWSALRARLTAASSTDWRLFEVASGVPRLVGGATEQFVPQMINLDAIGALSFTKGCFAGQEVVARTQNLGRLKRRMLLARFDGETPAPGADLLGQAGSEPVGQVVMTASAADRPHLLLAEASLESQQGALRLASGEPLEILPLPYRLPIIDNERIKL